MLLNSFKHCFMTIFLIGFSSCNMEDLPTTTTAFNDDIEITSITDILISRNMLTELVNEAAKLKDTPATKEIPVEKLAKLMLLLQWNVRDGAKLVPMKEDVSPTYLIEIYARMYTIWFCLTKGLLFSHVKFPTPP